MWSRVQLRGKWRAGSGVFVFSWICISCHDVKLVCHDCGHVRGDGLWRRQGVPGRRRAASVMHVQRWLRIDGDDNCRLCGEQC